MRRIAVILTVLAALMPASNAHAGIRVEHRTHAVFVLPEKNGVHPALFVSALRMAGPEASLDSPGSVPVLFHIGWGECSNPGSLDSCIVTDRGDSIGGRFRDGDVFEFDEDLSTAHLRVTRKGITHDVRWAATSDPTPVVRAGGCGLPTVATEFGVQREAVARGRVFGHKVRTLDSGGFDATLTSVAFTC